MLKGILKSSLLLGVAFMIITTSAMKATEYQISSLALDSKVVVEMENGNEDATVVAKSLWMFACSSSEVDADRNIYTIPPIIGTCLPGSGTAEYTFKVIRSVNTLTQYKTLARAELHRLEWTGAPTGEVIKLFQITNDKVIVCDVEPQSMKRYLYITHVDSIDEETHVTTIHITIKILSEVPVLHRNSF